MTSEQTVSYHAPGGRASHRAHPLLMQWLATWNHTTWWRTTVTHAVMAAPRDGHALWPDLLQANFPLLDATWNEVDYGPVTDRIVSLIMEVRFREAPWPLLPSAAGRLYWEYGGEDFLPHDALPVIPEISAPATLAGVELLGQRWDLAAEYLETRHPRVLWYSNSGYAQGFTHRGTVLGHPLGGAAEAWTALVRWRPASGTAEWQLRGRTAAWAMAGRLPQEARRQEITLTWRRLAGRGAWSLGAGWIGEEAGDRSAHWLQAHLDRRF